MLTVVTKRKSRALVGDYCQWFGGQCALNAYERGYPLWAYTPDPEPEGA